MNFGHKLIIGMLLFMGFIIFMVVKSVQQNFDLVTDNYYQKELEYQKIIDKKKNAVNIQAQVKINKSDNVVEICLPEKLTSVKGSLYLFRPSDKNLDIEQPFDSNIIRISINSLKKGKYIMQLDFSDGQESYFIEQNIFI